MTRSSQLTVRLDEDSKSLVAKAAELRKISISDYMRKVAVELARREVSHSKENTIGMMPAEQFAFWHALNAKPKLTNAQHNLGRVMRGEG